MRDPFFRRFFGGPASRSRQIAAGSGVIVDAKNGYVMTNAHVVKDAREVLVTLKDNRRLPAKLVGADPGTDIAVVRVDLKNLVDVKFGDSDALQVGDFVIAIGNPVRPGPDGDLRHRLGARAQRPVDGGLRALHPDRRLDQSRKLRRGAGEPEGRARRHQHRDHRPGRRQRRHRLRGAGGWRTR